MTFDLRAWLLSPALVAIAGVSSRLDVFKATVMATQAEILEKLNTGLQTLSNIKADVAALKELVDSGGNLDAISAKVDELNAALGDVDDDFEPVTPG